MHTPQSGILLPPPSLARYLSFSLTEKSGVTDCLKVLREMVDGENTVAGFGTSLVIALGKVLPGLRPFPPVTAPGLSIDSAPDAVWLWLRGDDRGELLHRSRQLNSVLSPAFRLQEIWDAFKYREGRDLSGYEDGTENPIDEAAVDTAIVGPGGGILAGSSFVATQRWIHNFERFEVMSGSARDYAVGRRQADNEELPEAPESAHVKRTAQESFSPEAFVLRRSMPWAEGLEGGLMFVAFGKTFEAFEAQFRRMTGSEDGIVDAIFAFTQPVSGAYFWCPAMKTGKLDFSPLGI